MAEQQRRAAALPTTAIFVCMGVTQMAKKNQEKGSQGGPAKQSPPAPPTPRAQDTAMPASSLAPTDQPEASSTTPQVLPPAAPARRYDLRQGLFDFCTSQAEVMLAQYRDINQLLGPTTDWTAPGTLCEVLVRDLIRRVLPSRYSVDKGFVFGRRMKDTKEVHSPEIDVLIHDTLEYAPVYRLEDFVIVQPAAVRGIIQVKRTLDGDALEKAIKNLVDAKEHLKAFGMIRIPNKDEDIFSAAMFFGDDLILDSGGISRTYATTLQILDQDEPLARPHFLGSLQNRFYVVPFGSKDRYEGAPSRPGGGNVALVTFLAYLTQYILPSYSGPTFYRPAGATADEVIPLGRPNPPPSSATAPRPANQSGGG